MIKDTVEKLRAEAAKHNMCIELAGGFGICTDGSFFLNNDYWKHYNWNTNQLPSPSMSDFVKTGFTFPAIEKRPVVK